MAASSVDRDATLSMQLDSRIESLTARQRDRQPAAERPRIPPGSEYRLTEPFRVQGETPGLPRRACARPSVPGASREPPPFLSSGSCGPYLALAQCPHCRGEWWRAKRLLCRVLQAALQQGRGPPLQRWTYQRFSAMPGRGMSPLAQT